MATTLETLRQIRQPSMTHPAPFRVHAVPDDTLEQLPTCGTLCLSLAAVSGYRQPIYKLGFLLDLPSALP